MNAIDNRRDSVANQYSLRIRYAGRERWTEAKRRNNDFQESSIVITLADTDECKRLWKGFHPREKTSKMHIKPRIASVTLANGPC